MHASSASSPVISFKSLNSKAYTATLVPGRNARRRNDGRSRGTKLQFGKKHRVKAAIMLNHAGVWTHAPRTRWWAEISDGDPLQTAQRVDRKGPRAEMRGQSELRPGGGTRSTSLAYRNGNTHGRSNRWPGFERQAPMMPFLHGNPWRIDPAVKKTACLGRRQITSIIGNNETSIFPVAPLETGFSNAGLTTRGHPSNEST
jgi:hypothetical protein